MEREHFKYEGYGYAYDEINDIDKLVAIFELLDVKETTVATKRPCTTNGEPSFYYDSHRAKRIKGGTFVYQIKGHPWDKDPKEFSIAETIEVASEYKNSAAHNVIVTDEVTDSENLMLLLVLNGLITDADEFTKLVELKLDNILKYRKERAPYIELDIDGKSQSVYFEYGDFWIGFNLDTSTNKAGFGVSGLIDFEDNDIPVYYKKDSSDAQNFIQARMRSNYVEFAEKNTVRRIANGYVINDKYYETLEQYEESRDWEEKDE